MYETFFFIALGLTMTIETACAALLYTVPAAKAFFGFPRLSRTLGFTAAASAATLPYLWFVAPAFLPQGFVLTAVGEAAVTAAEAVFLCATLPLRFSRALVLSLVINAVSFTIGLAIF